MTCPNRARSPAVHPVCPFEVAPVSAGAPEPRWLLRFVHLSWQVVVLDTSIPVRQAFHALYEQARSPLPKGQAEPPAEPPAELPACLLPLSRGPACSEVAPLRGWGQGVHTAPLWDEDGQAFVGMISLGDFIALLCRLQARRPPSLHAHSCHALVPQAHAHTPRCSAGPRPVKPIISRAGAGPGG